MFVIENVLNLEHDHYSYLLVYIIINNKITCWVVFAIWNIFDYTTHKGGIVFKELGTYYSPFFTV